MKIYDKESRRLVYIEESATPDFWDSHWNAENFKEAIERGKCNRFVLKTLEKYIANKNGRILEGGCGRGQVAYCMHVQGYESVDVDFAEKTIEQVKDAIPELDVRVGDVRDLQFPDNYFTGYWSLRVIEHFWDGYYDILKEMRRVLINGGYVFLTFPYMLPLRRLKAKFCLYEEFNRDGEEKENFYQFALDPDTVIKDFEAIGFKFIGKKSRGGIGGFKEGVSIAKPLLQKLSDYQGKSLWIKGFWFVLDKLLATFGAGHMMFFVLRNVK